MSTSSPSVDVSLVLFLSTIFSWELIRNFRLRLHYEHSYWQERRGRTRVEHEMKRLTEVQLKTTEGFFVQPIGTIYSCFRQCVGTPRQGKLAPSSRATLTLDTNMSPESLDGLEEFSHVWLTFQFHLNTNSLKEARAFKGAYTSNNTNSKFTFTAKITPPMLKEKKGVLATRSPHRPNPLGVTLARIERIDKMKRKVYLSSCDLVQGTPVLDIKPYVPSYDTVDDFRIPDWIQETIGTRNTVVVSDKARNDVFRIQKKLKQYKNEHELFLKALVETLEADVRSKFQTKRRITDAVNGIYVDVPFDETIVQYFWIEDRVMEIGNILSLSEYNALGNIGIISADALLEGTRM